MKTALVVMFSSTLCLSTKLLKNLTSSLGEENRRCLNKEWVLGNGSYFEVNSVHVSKKYSVCS